MTSFIEILKEDYGFAFDYAELDDKIDDALRVEDFDTADALQIKLNAAANKYYELQDDAEASLKKINKDFPSDYNLVASIIEDNAWSTWFDEGGTDSISEYVRNAFVWGIIRCSYDSAREISDYHDDLRNGT